MKVFAILGCLFLAVSANAVIPGFETGVNDNGFNFSAAVLTPITTTGAPGSGQWDSTYFNKTYGVFKPQRMRGTWTCGRFKPTSTTNWSESLAQ
jgi:hypothetical protein